jgi:hypothetical protein
LLRLTRDELAALGATEPEGDFPAEIPVPRFLVRLHLPDAFADAVSLGFGEGGGNRQEQF